MTVLRAIISWVNARHHARWHTFADSLYSPHPALSYCTKLRVLSLSSSGPRIAWIISALKSVKSSNIRQVSWDYFAHEESREVVLERLRGMNIDEILSSSQFSGLRGFTLAIIGAHADDGDGQWSSSVCSMLPNAHERGILSFKIIDLDPNAR